MHIDRQIWHLNLIFHLICVGQLSQFLRCYVFHWLLLCLDISQHLQQFTIAIHCVSLFCPRLSQQHLIFEARVVIQLHFSVSDSVSIRVVFCPILVRLLLKIRKSVDQDQEYIWEVITKTSQELRMLSKSLSDCKSLTLNVKIQVSQFVSNSQLSLIH